jgi:hypothetical protein
MPETQSRTKAAASVRLSREAKQLLAVLAEKRGVSQAALLASLIHEKAREERIGINEASSGAKSAARQRLLTLLDRVQSHDPGDMTPAELEHEVTLAHEEAREISRARRR